MMSARPAHAARATLSLALLIVTALPATALDFTFKAAGNYSNTATNKVFIDAAVQVFHNDGPFTLSWDLVGDSKGTYAIGFDPGFTGDFAFDIQNAGFGYQAGSLELYLGKLPLHDEVDSPYSLFLRGDNPSAMTGGFRYESGNFSFTNRWVGLDLNTTTNLYRENPASNIYRDRGGVLRSYAYRFGNLRLGFQDATLFTDAYFSVDVFALPAISYFVQYVLFNNYRPGARSGNMNTLMGFFGDYQGEGWKVYGQILVDDFNVNQIINPTSSWQNPDKIAWSLGGKINTPMGHFSLHTAGATRYTFESWADEYYSYTLHPSSAVVSSESSLVLVPIEDQMLGYIHGENNIAFLAVWNTMLGITSMEAAVEYVLSGQKAPTNPWHNGEDFIALGTQFLNDPVLESKITLALRANRQFGSFSLFAQGSLGYVANRSNPLYPGITPGHDPVTYPQDNQPNLEPLYSPTTGDSGFLFELRLGGSWKLNL